MPSVDNTRPSHSGPVPVSTLFRSTIAESDASVLPVVDAGVPSPAPSNVVVVSLPVSAMLVVGAGSTSIEKEICPLPFGSSSLSLTVQVATHRPWGRPGAGISTVIVLALPLKVGRGTR